MFLLKILSWQILLKIVKVEKKSGVGSAEHEIYESIEHRLKSKIGKIFKNEETIEEYSGKIYEIDPYFSEHYKKKNYKLIKMVNNIYCLELIFFLLNTV